MRLLEDVEITMLEEQGCTAENWLAVMVSEEFRPDAVHNVNFYGTVELGAFYDNIEVEEGFWKRSGIRNATLRNVTIGDNCLIENVSGHISGYDIAPGCYIANVGTISALATDFGNGIELSVLSEAGEPNVVLSDKLTAQLAFLMIQSNAVFKMVKKECAMDADTSERGVIGERVRITFTREISNARVGDYCEVQGASRISNTSLMSSDDAPTFIGSDVIIENSIVAQGASVVDGAKVDSCFVGENVHVGKGFTAISSLFFANCFLDNGEANASFLGPFCTARHKSTFLVGGVFLFYDAAAGVNQSNHLYKTGPLHWGRFDRGAKTTNNSHIDWPAHIGAFSLLKGDLTSHPDLSTLPFSVITVTDGKTYVEPGRNFCSVGVWRDVEKWKKRDLRPLGNRRDYITTDFPNPYLIQQTMEARDILRRLVAEQGEEVEEYTYGKCFIKREALLRANNYYDMVIKVFIGHVIHEGNMATPYDTGADQWIDLAGLLAPRKEIMRLLSDVDDGMVNSIDALTECLRRIKNDYPGNCAGYAHSIIQREEGKMFYDEAKWTEAADEARALWVKTVRQDAEQEYTLGDIPEMIFRKFLDTIN